MSLEMINLRKILKLMFLGPNELTAALRQDIREDRDRELGVGVGGGDFYGPFWKDAKDHVFGHSDLRTATQERIEANDRRKNLYPLLMEGFLLWWDQKRRWTNAPFSEIDTPKTRYKVPHTDTTIKIDCVLAVQDGRDDERYVYPYWFPEPGLTDESGRLGLWVLTQALPQIGADETRILDVIRGQTFSVDRTPLTGREANEFSRHLDRISQRRRALREEYDH